MIRGSDYPGDPPLLAHRGYAARYPENTREALRAAVEAGARNIEFDIQLSADGVPFLLHDADFRRTAGVDRSIFATTAAEIAAIDVGEPGRFGDRFRGVHAPSLADVVEDIKLWPEVHAFIELKRESIEHFGLETVVQAIVKTVQPVIGNCVFISFDYAAVELARRYTGCRVGWALREWSEASHAAAIELRPDFLFCNITRLPPLPELLWYGIWQWVIYEVTEVAVVRDLAARGVSMIETMACAELAEALQATPDRRSPDVAGKYGEMILAKLHAAANPPLMRRKTRTKTRDSK